jgi:hypothetical protein
MEGSGRGVMKGTIAILFLEGENPVRKVGLQVEI